METPTPQTPTQIAIVGFNEIHSFGNICEENERLKKELDATKQEVFHLQMNIQYYAMKYAELKNSTSKEINELNAAIITGIVPDAKPFIE